MKWCKIAKKTREMARNARDGGMKVGLKGVSKLMDNVLVQRVVHPASFTRHISYSPIQPPTMPPIRSQSSQNRTEQEGRILLAIQDFQNQKISSIRQLARDFDVSVTTLRRRISGIKVVKNPR
jgi:hypothetical protein